MNIKAIKLLLPLLIVGSTVYAHKKEFKFKNKDDAISALTQTKKRVFENGNIFSSKVPLADWNVAFDKAVAFIESNAKMLGSADSDITKALADVRSANQAMVNTITTARESYFAKKIVSNVDAAKDYVTDNMIMVRNVLINVEKTKSLQGMIIPSKKSAVAVLLSLANKLKDIANKSIDDSKSLANTPSATKTTVNQLDDILNEDLEDYVQEMETKINATPPVDATNFKKWISALRQLNVQIGQIDGAVAKKYQTRITALEKKGAAGLNPVIKPSLK